MSSLKAANVSEEFNITLQLYDVLERRQRKSRIFLQRNWRTPLREVKKEVYGDALPAVLYTCGHQSVVWGKEVPNLRCLFCSGLLSVRFAHEGQLLDHLQACHGRLRFSMRTGKQTSAGEPKVFVVQVKLMSDTLGLRVSRPDKLFAWDTEAVYANPTRYPTFNVRSGGKASVGSWKSSPWNITQYVTAKPTSGMSDKNNTEGDAIAPAAKRRRLSSHMDDPSSVGEDGEKAARRNGLENLHAFNRKRLASVVRKQASIPVDLMTDFITCHKPGLETARSSAARGSNRRRTREPVNVEEEDLEGSDYGSDSDSEGGDGGAADQVRAPASNGRAGSRVKASKRSKGSPSFVSFEDGVSRSIVYRSVLQSQPNVDDFGDGADSDAENVIDEDWRLELGDRLLSDFNDTSAQEKCYMNLWNQFVLREVYVYSDKRQLDVASMFASRYGSILFRMHLEVIFVRHLRELYQRGLLDATGMHQAVVELGNARMRAETDESIIADRMSHFSFHDRITRRGAEQKSNGAASQTERVSRDQESKRGSKDKK